MQNKGKGFLEFWREFFPPVTRWWVTSILVTLLLGVLGIVPPKYMVYTPTLAFKHFQIWRIVTCFLFIGLPSFPFFLTMIFLITYSKSLENFSYQGNPAEYLWMLIVCGAVFLIVAPLLNIIMLGDMLAALVCYIYCRRNPDKQVSLYGLLQIQLKYFPFVSLALRMLMGRGVIGFGAAMLVGHLYWLLADDLPKKNNQVYIKTPQFLVNLVNKNGDNNNQFINRGYGYTNRNTTRNTNTNTQTQNTQTNNTSRYKWGDGNKIGKKDK
ncbi:derlin-1 [Anaeramoeba flamelloides]|uniref:Derlin n=1 Tax=Anaeramoeba flamelloides TaxID=1746091 RepID=A0ABQ8X668_9EUKA|nr:derlin-1 [Anaeramoeba flamelloides]